MKRIITIIMLAMLCMGLASSCNKVENRGLIPVSPSEITFTSDGGQQMVDFKFDHMEWVLTETDADYKDVKGADVYRDPSKQMRPTKADLEWLHLELKSETTFSLTADANTTGQPRYAVVVLNDPTTSYRSTKVKITQK